MQSGAGGQAATLYRTVDDQRWFPENVAEESSWYMRRDSRIAVQFSENRRFFVTAKVGLALHQRRHEKAVWWLSS